MRTTRNNFRLSAIALALSIAAMPGLVNGQAQSLTSVNKAKSSNKPDIKDSVRNSNSSVAQLIAEVLKKGTIENTGSNLSPVIGLPKAMSAMDVEVDISKRAEVRETRRCFVVYEISESPAEESGNKRAICAYVVRTKRSGLDKETKYFKFNLNGKLEKVVLSHGKHDSTGKAVRGSGVKTDLDINSAEVKETFDIEMKFWLKDWLKKEQKNAAKKTVDAAKPNPAATRL